MVVITNGFEAAVQMRVTETTKRTDGLRVEGLPGLSRNARTSFANARRKRVWAVTVAVETAAA